MFGAVNLNKDADPDKYKYSGCSIGVDVGASFLLPDASWIGKDVIIFGADMSSSAHVDNKKTDILTLGKGPTQGLNDTTLPVEKEYFIINTLRVIDFSEQVSIIIGRYLFIF